MMSSLSDMMAAEAILLRSTYEKKGRHKRQKEPQKSEDLKGKLKAEQGLCFVFWWEV